MPVEVPATEGPRDKKDGGAEADGNGVKDSNNAEGAEEKKDEAPASAVPAADMPIEVTTDGREATVENKVDDDRKVGNDVSDVKDNDEDEDKPKAKTPRVTGGA